MKKKPSNYSECLSLGLGLTQPCPYRECRYHLVEGKRQRTYSGQLCRSTREADDGLETCALAVAQDGGLTGAEVGAMLGISRQRAEQIEATALLKIRKRLIALDRESAHDSQRPNDLPIGW